MLLLDRTRYQHDRADTIAALRSSRVKLGVAMLDVIPVGMQAQRLVCGLQVLGPRARGDSSAISAARCLASGVWSRSAFPG